MKKILLAIEEFLKRLFSKKEEPQIVSEPETGNTEPTVVETAETESNEIEEIFSAETITAQTIYKKMVILLDNGHAKSTAGKRSPILPDGAQFFEYEFNRDIVKRIAKKLAMLGIEFKILVPEVEEDIKLSVRAARANNYCNEYGAANCLLISVHANAGSNGGWQSGRGWSVYTTKGNTKSDEYATIFYEEAEKILPQYNMTLRKDMQDGDPDYEENFTVIYLPKCPALLTENLFMDNKKDVEFLMSEEGREAIAQIHINAIKRICAA